MALKNPFNHKKFSSVRMGLDFSSDTNPYVSYILMILGLLLLYSMFTFDDGEFGKVKNSLGRAGWWANYGLFYLFGRGAYLLPLSTIIYGALFLQKKVFDVIHILLSALLLIFTISIFGNIFETTILSIKHGGGVVGTYLSDLGEYAIGPSGRFILNSFLFLYAGVIIVKYSPNHKVQKFMKNFPDYVYRWHEQITKQFTFLKNLFGKKTVTETGFSSGSFGSSNEKETSKTRFYSSFFTGDVPWVEIKKVKVGGETDQEPDSDLDFSSNRVKNMPFAEVKNSVKPEYNFSTVYETFPLNDRNPKESVASEKVNISEIKFKSTSPELVEKLRSQSNFSLSDDVVISELEGVNHTIVQKEDPNYKVFEAQFPTTTAEKPSPPFVVEESDLPLHSTTNPEELPFKDMPPKPEIVSNASSLIPEFKMLRAAYHIGSHCLKPAPKRQKKRSDREERLESEKIAYRIIDLIKHYTGYTTKYASFEKGPTNTLYEFSVPELGDLDEKQEPVKLIKLYKVTELEAEFKLYLEAKSVRIIAPIPGKSTIGIEVPNKEKEEVLLGEVLRSVEAEAMKQSGDLPIILGKRATSSKIIPIELNKLPHLLIAGTTGSGKSVAMNSMICSLLYSKSPQDLRFIMIDPKMVELALYEEIPHLLMPVITDPRKASKALYWAVQEMEARYALVSELKCRDLKSYNERLNSGLFKSKKNHRKLPYIVIFIDELADLMMVSGKELEDYITRISQKARAVGIHLVMATQRPSVDVITGLIKANCPARMAFHVAQKTDSKIILDYNGADALLGQGDLLYRSPTSSDLQRIQSPYVSGEEIEKIVNETKKFGAPQYVAISFEDEAGSGSGEGTNDEDEEMFEEAWEIVRTEQKASASYLQRRLRIGYNKAARLMELMEERGYVGPQIGSKPREILRG
jgi:DNA segregation ATPase FtsK/SpoIIIE, S-DNA-T family